MLGTRRRGEPERGGTSTASRAWPSRKSSALSTELLLICMHVPPASAWAWAERREKIWFRPRVVLDRRETSTQSHYLTPWAHQGTPLDVPSVVVRSVPSISSDSEHPAHDRHNLPGPTCVGARISTSARALSTWRRSRSLFSIRWPVLSCVCAEDQARRGQELLTLCTGAAL